MRQFLIQVALITLSFWCMTLQSAEIRTNINYKSQINSQFDRSENVTGLPAFDTIHTPLPTHIDIWACNISICGTLPGKLESSLEFDPSTSYVNTTAANNGLTYTFTGNTAKVTAHGNCTMNQTETGAICVWDKSLSLPLTLTTHQSGVIINQQNVIVTVEPGGGNSDTNQYSSLSGNIIFNESVVNFTGYEPETTGIENLRFKWTVKVVEDTEGDIGTWNGSLTLNGSPASTIKRNLLPEDLNASFSAHSINQNAEIVMTGAQNDTELIPIYLYHGTTTCDDTPLCAYSINNASTTISCHDQNAQLTFNRTCNASATTQCQDGKIGNVKGTWGRVNIDTMCAVTVLLPYE
ncbi:hypothetical protein FNI11_14685 [Salmonella enterica subsp. salamae]|nr:hypothetical protein [Salmonella enterica subsp. salamae]ECJ2281761.1 hypothetical protein [Salmonella enterica subsp. salamae]